MPGIAGLEPPTRVKDANPRIDFSAEQDRGTSVLPSRLNQCISNSVMSYVFSRMNRVGIVVVQTRQASLMRRHLVTFDITNARICSLSTVTRRGSYRPRKIVNALILLVRVEGEFNLRHLRSEDVRPVSKKTKSALISTSNG